MENLNDNDNADDEDNDNFFCQTKNHTVTFQGHMDKLRILLLIYSVKKQNLQWTLSCFFSVKIESLALKDYICWCHNYIYNFYSYPFINGCPNELSGEQASKSVWFAECIRLTEEDFKNSGSVQKTVYNVKKKLTMRKTITRKIGSDGKNKNLPKHLSER